MHLEKLAVQRFRNISQLEMAPGEGMNVIHGENAQGKTNLLEAIYVLSTLRSFRTRQLSEVLQFGEDQAWLQATVQSGQGRHGISVCVEEKTRHPVLNRKKVEALHYLGVFDVFSFSFPLLEVVRGGPEDRRRFLDRSIAVSKPAYLPLLVSYYRAMKQKNALLNSIQKGDIGRKDGVEQIDSFQQQMLERGLEITAERVAYLTLLRELLQKKRQLFFEKDLALGLELKSSFLSSRQDVERNMERILDREIAMGCSLMGVHRDEIRMSINGKELRKFGSSGQHRAFLLLLLLAQLQLYEEWRQERPVLLLDDLDSELDGKRIQEFLDEIRNNYQTVISSSRTELFKKESGTRFYRITSGELLEM